MRKLPEREVVSFQRGGVPLSVRVDEPVMTGQTRESERASVVWKHITSPSIQILELRALGIGDCFSWHIDLVRGLMAVMG